MSSGRKWNNIKKLRKTFLPDPRRPRQSRRRDRFRAIERLVTKFICLNGIEIAGFDVRNPTWYWRGGCGES